MSVPLHLLTSDQRFWFGQYIVAAVLADDIIDASETDYIQYVINIVDHPDYRKEIVEFIRKKEKPLLTKPIGIKIEILVAIFLELALIMISDMDFHDEERLFLKQTAKLFDFTDSFFEDLIKWAEAGLQWKNERTKLIAGEGEFHEIKLLLLQLSAEQKRWYADVLVAIIMSSDGYGTTDKRLLKSALSVPDTNEERQELMGYIKNNVLPPIRTQPDIEKKLLVTIFLELIMIVSADEFLSTKEHSVLKRISDACGFSDPEFLKLLEWCKKGIIWKKSKNDLIKKGKNQHDKSITILEEKFVVEPCNNSIMSIKLGCFICNTKREIKIFRLIPDSHKQKTNIFGVATYNESNKGFDYIDFNRLRVSICPSCYFASVENRLFKRKRVKEIPADISHPEFIKYWLKQRPQNRLLFKNHPDMYSHERSIAVVTKIYQLAIDANQVLRKINKNESKQWSEIVLSLHLAEILMSNGKRQAAEKQLLKTQKAAIQQFSHTSKRLSILTFKNAKVIFLISLYFAKYDVSESYFEFFKQVYTEKADGLCEEEQQALDKIYKDVQVVYKNRKHYLKENLNGFLHK